MSSDALSEESSVYEGVGYDETFGSGDESEDFSPSLEREMSAQSPDGEDESYAEGSEEVGVDKVGKKWNGSDGDNDGDEEDNDGDEEDGDGDEEDDDEESSEGTSVGLGDNRPFILPEEWAVNKFLPLMSDKVFKELRTRYQIPEHIPIHLPRENERCYSGRTTDVGMYDAMFAAGPRLPLTALYRHLVDFLGLFVSQIAPNAWRTFIGVEIL